MVWDYFRVWKVKSQYHKVRKWVSMIKSNMVEPRITTFGTKELVVMMMVAAWVVVAAAVAKATAVSD